MPNHVTHRVVVTGSATSIATFKKTFLITRMERCSDGTEAPYTCFDFEILVSMPAALREAESGPEINDGLFILGRSDISSDYGFGESPQRRLERYLSYQWVKDAGVTDIEGLKNLLLARSPDCIEKAQRAIECYETYGHISWYSWSIDNWGTKWNSYAFHEVDDRDGHLEFMFDTAWSSPVPIFEALAVRPEVEGLTFTIHGFDELWNFAFIGAIGNGHFLGDAVEATDKLYTIVYGSAPPNRDRDDDPFSE